MNRISRRAWLVIALASLPLMVNCSDNAPTNVYDLIVQNQTANPLELFINTTGGFVKVGDVAPSTQGTVRNLTHGQSYTFRLCLVGQGPGTFAYERVVMSDGPDVTWTVP